MANYDLLSNTNIYKNTYNELICWVRDLHWWVRYYRGLDELNKAQARRIMELEFDLQRYSSIMVEDKQETVMKDFSIPEGELVSNEEFEQRRLKRGGGGGGKKTDWLSDMEWGTQFYARQRGQSQQWMLVKFMLAGIRQKTALLVPMLGAEDVVSDDRNWLPVDPALFCRNWELYDAFPPIPLEKDDENK